MLRSIIVFICLLLLPFSYASADFEYDPGFQGNSDVWLGTNTLIVSAPVRIYARVTNFGSKDVTAFVSFFQGNILIEESKPISLIAGGVFEEVFVDWIVPQGQFNIIAKIQGASPRDDSESNNQALTAVFVPDIDTDNDGVADSQDTDDDNDGLNDSTENERGTNPLLADTDSDGFNDLVDKYPLDETKHDEPVQVKKEEENTKKDESKQEVKKSTQIPAPKEKISVKQEPNLLVDEKKEIKTNEKNGKLSNSKEVTSPTLTSTETFISVVQALEVGTRFDFEIVSQRVSWRGYVFSLSRNVFDNAAQFTWSWTSQYGKDVIFGGDFPEVNVRFPGPGKYNVKVEIKDGEALFTDEEVVSVGIFHPSNAWLQNLVLLLASVVLVSSALLIKPRKINVPVAASKSFVQEPVFVSELQDEDSNEVEMQNRGADDGEKERVGEKVGNDDGFEMFERPSEKTKRNRTSEKKSNELEKEFEEADLSWFIDADKD